MYRSMKMLTLAFVMIPMLWYRRGINAAGTIFGNDSILLSSYFTFSDDFTVNGEQQVKVHPQTGVVLAEALRYAVLKINNDTSIMHGYSIDQVAKNSDTIASEVVFDFLSDSFGEIGPGGSEEAYVTSILANSLQLPVISYDAGYPGVRVDRPVDFFFRTVPSDVFRVRATLDVLHRLGWTYVGVISSYANDGERSARIFGNLLDTIDACLAVEASLGSGSTDADYDVIVMRMSKVNNMKAIVLFTNEKDSIALLRALQRNDLSQRFHLVSVYGFAGYDDVIAGLELQADGTIGIEVSTTVVKEFEDHFLALTPDNNSDEHFKTFWEATFQCSLTSNVTKPLCPPDASLGIGRGYYPHTPIEPVVGAAYALATAIGHVVVEECADSPIGYAACNFDPEQSLLYATSLRSELQKMSFADGTLNISVPWMNNWRSDRVAYDIWSFSKVGSGPYLNRKAGLWTFDRHHSKQAATEAPYNIGPGGLLSLDISKLRLKMGERSYGVAVCSKPCPVGSVRLPDSHLERKKCCWSCRSCLPNAAVFNDTCFPCGLDAQPNLQRTGCIARNEHYVYIVDSLNAQFLVSASVLGLVLTTAVAMVFLRYNDSRIVKASGRDLCYFLLIGACACFVTPICFVLRPSIYLCGIRGIMPGISFILCYAPLFLKTNRIYRIFRGAQVSVSRPPLISPQSQIVILTAILMVQGLVGAVWMVSRPPELLKTLGGGQELWLLCKDDAFPLFLNLGMSVVFMISCTWMAFKTRNFPKNFNEAKYIGFTMYITCICWALFLPTYFVLPDNSGFLRQSLVAVLCIVIGYVTLFGLFGHRVKLLLIPASVELHAQGHLYSTSKVSRKGSVPPHVIVLSNGKTGRESDSTSNYDASIVRSDSSANVRNVSF